MSEGSSAMVDLVIMLGESGNAFPEELLGRVREAIALDLIEKGLSLSQVRRIVVSTKSHSFAEHLAGLPVRIVFDSRDNPFHFGRQLHAVVRESQLERVLYIGGGAAPLLTLEQLEAMVTMLAAAPNRLVTNNLYSSDMVGFSAELLERITLPERDNDLAWSLAQLGGLDVRQPPRSAGTSFDVDTITDVLILTMCPNLGRHTAQVIHALDLDTSKLRAALERLKDPEAVVLLIGRVSSDVWHTMQQRVRCTVRIISEERGMRASGRLARGEVRSLLGIYAEQYGFEELFAHLSRNADAVFLDSRVLFAHLGPWPSDADRCYSDLAMPEKIVNPTIRRLTEAAIHAPIPIVMGGHSLLSGGMLALLEAVGL